jgi:hypothetical protein
MIQADINYFALDAALNLRLQERSVKEMIGPTFSVRAVCLYYALQTRADLLWKENPGFKGSIASTARIAFLLLANAILDFFEGVEASAAGR